MFEAASWKALVCSRCYYRFSNFNQKPQSAKFLSSLLTARKYYATAAAIAEEPAYEDSTSPIVKNDQASKTSSRRGERLRKRLRAKKAADPKKATDVKSTKKQGHQSSWGSLKKPYPYSIVEGGKYKQFVYGHRHESVPLGIDSLGQPAKAVIVQDRSRVSTSNDRKHPLKGGDWVSGTDTLFENLSKEGELLEPEEVYDTISQLKAPLARKLHLTKPEWVNSLKKIRDSFQRDQLVQFIKLAREKASDSEEGRMQSIFTEGTSTTKIDHEHSKHKIAEYILRDVWGFVPATQKSDEELHLSPEHFGVVAHLKSELLRELEQKYQVRIDLLSEQTALKLHFDKEGDEDQISVNREEAYEKLLQFCQDITARKIRLRPRTDTPDSAWRRLLTKPYLDHISNKYGAFVTLSPPKPRRKGTQQSRDKLELQIHYPGKLYDPSHVRHAEKELSLSLHWARRRSSTYRWWNKTIKPTPVHVEKPGSCTWHQQTDEWARLVLPKLTENECLSSQTLATSLLERVSQNIRKRRFPKGTFTRDSVSFGHILTQYDRSGKTKEPPVGMTERKILPPMSTQIPFVPHALSSFDCEPVHSQQFEQGGLRQDRFLFVPSPLCESDLPTFEVILSSTSATRRSARIARMSTILLSVAIDVPLPHYNCDLRFDRRYIRDLTPPTGFNASEWHNVQGTKPISDRMRPVESLVAHLPGTWQEDKGQFSFAPLIDIAVPNAWMQRKGSPPRQPNASDHAERIDFSDNNSSPLKAEITQATETALPDAFYRGVPVPNCESSRFTYLCAAGGTVDEAWFRGQNGSLCLDTTYDALNDTRRQDLIMEGPKLAVRAIGGAYGTQTGDKQVVKAFLAQALEYAGNFGRQEQKKVLVF